MPSPRTPIAPLLLLATLGACESSTPTLPLPPPNALVEAPPDAGGMVTVRLSALEPGALVFVYNERLEDGVIGRADTMGEATLRLRAAPGDALLVWQRIEERSSPPRTILVPEADGGAPPPDGG